MFGPTPELAAAAPSAPGLKTQKVTGFSECGGALFVSINTKLYRRNDGDLPPGVSRWQLVYEEPPVRALNSGLRGLSCVNHDGTPSLLLSTEGNGNVYRLDHLPGGQLRRQAPGLVPVLEFSPAPAISLMLSAHGTHVPAIGPGSIGYVIAAYNNFETVTVDGAERQLFGFEWAYRGGVCAPGRKCGPTALGGATYDAAACFGVRADRDSVPSYSLRCIVGPDFAPSGAAGKPIRSGQAFVSIRTITPSPFGDDRIYFGGYDCNFYPADGTAWIGSAASSALHLEEQS